MSYTGDRLGCGIVVPQKLPDIGKKIFMIGEQRDPMRVVVGVDFQGFGNGQPPIDLLGIWQKFILITLDNECWQRDLLGLRSTEENGVISIGSREQNDGLYMSLSRNHSGDKPADTGAHQHNLLRPLLLH